MDRTVLDDMEKYPEGLKSIYVRQVIWQVLKGVEFIHNHEVGVAGYKDVTMFGQAGCD